VTFEKAARLDDLWSGDMLGCDVGGQRVLLVRLGETVHAYEDRCAHLGVRLSEGKLNGTGLMCRAHYWEYDVETGQGRNPLSVCLRRFPVRIEDGRILVDVEGK
jgi:nitrite reductase/ring-hydroxylating ferredoxin subunit